LEKWTRQLAVADRAVMGFSVIWVMCTVWEGVRCGRSGSEVVGRDGDDDAVCVCVSVSVCGLCSGRELEELLLLRL
jgi:hypothetical protein